MAVSYERLLDEVQQATEDYQAIENTVDFGAGESADVASEAQKLQLNENEKSALTSLGKKLEEVSRVLLRMEEQKMALSLDITSEESFNQAKEAMVNQESTISNMNDQIREMQQSIVDKQKHLEEAVAELSKAKKQVAELGSVDDVPEEMLNFTEQMVLALKNFIGISVQDVTAHGFKVSTANLSMQIDLATHNDGTRVKEISFDDNELTHAKYAPFNSKSIHHILDEGIKRNDVVFLINELEAFFVNRKALNDELEEIAKNFPLSIVKREVVITLPEGVVLTVHITDDYPGRAGDSTPQARLVELDSLNGSKQSDADRVKAKYLETVGKRAPTLKHIVRDIMALLK